MFEIDIVWRHSGIITVNFEESSHIVLLFLMLKLISLMPAMVIPVLDLYQEI